MISSLFHPNKNEYHDKIIKNVHEYLLNKSVEILACGADVILDWGFWTKADRKHISKFYSDKNIQTQWHYLDVSQEQWQNNIGSRNDAVLKNEATDYYVDSGLLQKCNSMFEVPENNEIDVWCVV